MDKQPQGNYKQYSPYSVRNNEVGSGPTGRVLPRQLSTGSTRGTQTVGYGGAKIDGTNNRFVVTNSVDGTSIGLGNIPGTLNEFGFFSLNDQGVLIYKNVNGTQTYYNPNDNYNPSILLGSAPDDGRTGEWITKPGKNVIEELGG